MRYFIEFSLKNGLGHPSLDLYLTGCDKPIKCPNCHNPELQPKPNEVVSPSKIWEELKDLLLLSQGANDVFFVTFLGGEPLAAWNRHIVKYISKRVKANFPAVKTLVYSWRVLEDLPKLKDYLIYLDYGVFGSFQQENYEPDYLPASSNQYIYNFGDKRKEPKIKLNSQ